VLFSALGVTVTGCSSQGDTATSTTELPPTTATLIATTTQAATTTAPATTTEAPTTTAATTTTQAPTTTLPPFPPERESLEHGGETWVVILAASDDFGDPTLDQAVDDADAAGYTTGPTDCDVGVAEAVGLSEGSYVVSVSVYLETEADAEAALVAFEARGVDGTVALVQTFCLD
jgi:hypothetical protein